MFRELGNILGREEQVVVLRDARSKTWRVFRDPCRVVAATDPATIPECLAFLENQIERYGLHAAGFLAYEAALAFDPAFRVHPCADFPLLWFGLYKGFQEVERLPIPVPAQPPELNWTPSISENAYRRALARIRELLRVGETYQVNFTFRLRASFQQQPWEYFLSVCAADPPPHAAYVGLAPWAICSFSPELFFALDGEVVLSRPMKGTRPRGVTLERDLELADALRASAKDRAENVMITDMVRNDLGRIAMPGSVRVADICKVEKHATVWQMTSDVAARTNRSFAEILGALFPPASITGAPKAAATRIIADLETGPRRIYTGCVGHFGPNRQAGFNVAIRTVLVDRRQGLAEYGVGGGIVWDSDAQDEYEECRTKARLLDRRVPEFNLLETMLWTLKQGYVLLERHLARLGDSAEYFDFRFDRGAVRAALLSLAGGLGPEPRMVRLLLGRDGRLNLEDLPPPLPADNPPRVTLAASPVHSGDPFLYHKTTHRAVYAQALAARPGFDDVLLYNESGELTESTRSNVLAMLEGVLYTPPISCGLLAGTMRADLLESKTIFEQTLSVETLRRAEKIFLMNSVRGMYVVDCVSDEAT